MIENILIFVRNCVMAVLTAWAGIQLAENAPPQPAEPAPIAATGAVPMNVVDNGSNCPKNLDRTSETPASAASADPDRTVPTAQPSAMTVR